MPLQQSLPQVTAIVVSHDSGQCLLDAVRDLLAQTVPLDVVVVDNASCDGSIQRLPIDPRLRLIRNLGNPGFAVACNQGARVARAPRLLFINPDCRLAADTVGRLCAHLDAAPAVGLLGAALRNADGSPQAAAIRRTPHPRQAIAHLLHLRGKHRPSMPVPSPDVPALLDVEATSGALMLMPRDLFERLGGFDEGYVLHCEDLDLCRRVLEAGPRVAVATDVPITHLKGTSSRARPIWVEWQKHRGMWRYFRKFDAADSPWWLCTGVAMGLVIHFPLAAVRAFWRRA